MFSKTVKAIIAILFIPIVMGATKSFFQSMQDLGFLNTHLYIIIAGFFSYPVFHIVFFKPMYIYAWGHEIVHVLATWLSGGRVISFYITQAGGSVATSKTNLFIRLSPYFVPIHAIFLAFAFWILSNFYDMTKFYNEFIFLLAFTMSLHIFMTIEVMKVRQPDIVKTGPIFSVLFIYVANIFVGFLFLSFIFKSLSFIHFAKNTWLFSREIYIAIFEKLFS